MTKKDYIRIAQVFKAQLEIRSSDERQCHALRDTIYDLCQMMAEDNERFNWSTFTAACGIQGSN